jgi:hypothetical protein
MANKQVLQLHLHQMDKTRLLGMIKKEQILLHHQMGKALLNVMTQVILVVLNRVILVIPKKIHIK